MYEFMLSEGDTPPERKNVQRYSRREKLEIVIFGEIPTSSFCDGSMTFDEHQVRQTMDRVREGL